MTTTIDRPPAIVWGRGPTAVGILRCLHLAKIPTFVASPPRDAVARSRFYRPIPGASPWQGALDAGARDALRALPFDEAVVIPSADDTALWLSDIPTSDLARRVHVSTSSRDALEILQDKSQLQRVPARHGHSASAHVLIASAADIDAIPFDELDRVFIKPANSQKFSHIIGAKASARHDAR